MPLPNNVISMHAFVPDGVEGTTGDFFEKITEIAPAILYIFDLREMTNVWVNRSIETYLGYSDQDIKAMGEHMLQELMHPEDLERYPMHFEKLNGLTDGEIASFEYRMKNKSGDWLWLKSEEMIYARDAKGMIKQIVGSAHDVTDAHEREESMDLLAREMNHRVKNLFSIVSAMVGLAGRETVDVKTVTRDLRARIDSLAKAHSFTTDTNLVEITHVRDILGAILEPYSGRHRVLLSGTNPELDWSRITPLALIAHELVTNAAKYGGLSEIGSRVEIDISEEDLGDWIEVHWTETKPTRLPELPESIRVGFGSTLVERAAIQLRGTFTRSFKTHGIEAVLKFPKTIN